MKTELAELAEWQAAWLEALATDAPFPGECEAHDPDMTRVAAALVAKWGIRSN